MTASAPVALIHGAASSIAKELTHNLLSAGVRVVLFDHAPFEPAGAEENVALLPSSTDNGRVVGEAVKTYGRLDYLFNCFVPGRDTPPGYAFDYPQNLYERARAAAEAMVASESKGAIVNQCFTGSLHEGTSLEPAILICRGAITGVTRQICCQYGKAGIRINTIQAGLTDFPENEGLITDKTRARKPPVGRWATPGEIAKFMLFLALRNGYMSGQQICFDGGLTAGNTGT